ncbi:anti-sigma factor [Aquibacillus saliphilus]|uniref:anti-sigma factor n=1 Tax=Aquibacillus saliphilus TaxID=1909422 RepID=UPI001CEFCDD5|nr:anti-sigma factor [Aquibacillus saliphilus]
MSDEFSRKLKAYEKGELTDQELEEFEKELEKLEGYQKILEEQAGSTTGSTISNKRQQKIVRKGKWKARLQTALFAFGILIIFTFLSSVLTAVYYSWGNPDRVDEFRGVIDHTLTITNPYGYLGGTSTSTTPYFGLEATRDMKKQIGNETIKVGELEVNFLFSLMSSAERSYIGKESQSQPAFSHPRSDERVHSDWDQLEQLPEGTVVSAYVSFGELMESKAVEKLFSDKQMNLLWLAVDTGIKSEMNHGTIFDTIGFPSHPIWHEDDMITQSYEEESGLFGSSTVSESSSSLAYHEGDQDMLHDQFMKTLYFLQDHEKKSNRLLFGRLDLKKRINYLENHGILHYGAVITGPTKEIVKLQDEPLVEGLEVDEVEFWNWE